MPQQIDHAPGCIDNFLSFICGLVFLPIGILFIITAINTYQLDSDILTYGLTTTGVVTNEEYEFSANQHWYSYTIQYTVSNGDTLIEEKTDLHKQRYQVGEQLKMRYLIDMPHEVIIMKNHDQGPSLLFFLFPLGFTAAGLYGWYRLFFGKKEDD